MYTLSSMAYSSSFREVISPPMLEGAAGVVGGIVAADALSAWVVSKSGQTGNLALAVEGVTDFALAAVFLAVTARSAGALRILGSSLALGSIASFFVTLLTKAFPTLTIGGVSARQLIIQTPPFSTTGQAAQVVVSPSGGPSQTYTS